MMTRLLAILFLCLHALLAIAAGETGKPVPVPALKARVTDLTATLSPAQVADLEATLAAFEARKGTQVAVLVLPSTAPETIEQFGVRLLDAWRIGRKGIDDGAILIVARDDRNVRIEVGYGLEGVLNDATAKRIIAETITPVFKAGDLPGGIIAGVDAILCAVEQEALPQVEPGNAALPDVVNSDRVLLHFESVGENTFLFGLVFLAIGGAILRYFLGNLLASGLIGSLTAGLGWLFTGTVIGTLIGAGVGVFIALFGLDLLLSAIFSGRSGGSGGSGSGGGGFSGGGGGGGGGGASGSW